MGVRELVTQLPAPPRSRCPSPCSQSDLPQVKPDRTTSLCKILPWLALFHPSLACVLVPDLWAPNLWRGQALATLHKFLQLPLSQEDPPTAAPTSSLRFWYHDSMILRSSCLKMRWKWRKGCETSGDKDAICFEADLPGRQAEKLMSPFKLSHWHFWKS